MVAAEEAEEAEDRVGDDVINRPDRRFSLTSLDGTQTWAHDPGRTILSAASMKRERRCVLDLLDYIHMM